MEINNELIDKLSKLSKLDFDDKSRAAIIEDLTRIIGFVEKLDELDTDNVEPLIYVNDRTNVLRDDVVHHDITKEEALSIAPLKDSDYIKVPTVFSKNKK